MMPRAFFPILFVGAALLLAGCPSADPAATDDAGETLCDPALPPASAPCLEGQCGNPEFGVGQPCTPGGGECSDLPGFMLCTADFNDTDLWFCTKPCSMSGDWQAQCGSDAVCSGDPEDPAAGSGCMPASCADSDDAGVMDDAGG